MKIAQLKLMLLLAFILIVTGCKPKSEEKAKVVDAGVKKPDVVVKDVGAVVPEKISQDVAQKMDVKVEETKPDVQEQKVADVVTADTQAQVTADTQAQVTADTQAQVTADTQAQVTADTQAQVTADTQAQVTADVKAGDVTKAPTEGAVDNEKLIKVAIEVSCLANTEKDPAKLMEETNKRLQEIGLDQMAFGQKLQELMKDQAFAQKFMEGVKQCPTMEATKTEQPVQTGDQAEKDKLLQVSIAVTCLSKNQTDPSAVSSQIQKLLSDAGIDMASFGTKLQEAMKDPSFMDAYTKGIQNCPAPQQQPPDEGSNVQPKGNREALLKATVQITCLSQVEKDPNVLMTKMQEILKGANLDMMSYQQELQNFMKDQAFLQELSQGIQNCPK